jgi:hypothetical protein
MIFLIHYRCVIVTKENNDQNLSMGRRGGLGKIQRASHGVVVVTNTRGDDDDDDDDTWRLDLKMDISVCE